MDIVILAVFLSVLVLIHELGHFLAAKRFGLLVEEFGLGLPPRLWGKKIGETVYSLNLLPFGGFVKIYGEEAVADSRGSGAIPRERSFANLSVAGRSTIVLAGVLMNFLLGWLALSGVFLIGAPVSLLITEVRPESPAAAANLKVSDEILAAVNTAGETFEVQGRNIEDFISFINANKGENFALKMKRNGEVLEIEINSRLSPPPGEGALGVGLAEIGVPQKPLLPALKEGLTTSWLIVKTIFFSIFELVRSAVFGKAVLDSLVGPVGIAGVVSQAAAAGFVYLLQVFGLVSLNLAVLNVLPIPALDGGRLVFILAEKLKGTPISVRMEKFANAGGFAFLIALMVLVTIRDVARLF